MSAGPTATETQDLIVLCYHDVPEKVNLDDYGVDQRTFIATIEYFRRHDFNFVSLQDIIEAHEGKKPLPEKAIMLTFDDGYKTYFDFVFPLLSDYKIPSVIAIVSSWIDGNVPDTVKQEVMTWEEIKEVAAHPLVEVVSHSHDLHKGIIYNPQGNLAAAAVNRVFLEEEKTYEDIEKYRQRIKNDITTSKEILENKLGIKVRALAWPYGKYSYINAEDAKSMGIKINFALNDERATVHDLAKIERFLLFKNPTVTNLLKDLKILPSYVEQKRILQIDLDQIFDEKPERTEINLGKMLDRVKAMGVSTVYLQAFSDDQADGNIRSVYFPNDVLPMKADLFNRVTHQLITRTYVEVYAWMPVLSYVLPDQEKNGRLRVLENKEGEIQPSTSWYQRLTPFSDETLETVKSLYESMAAHSAVNGVVFQDDGYLNDFEDYNPSAVKTYKAKTGKDLPSPDDMTWTQKELWTQMKIDRINQFTQELMSVVKTYRPETKFARTIYAPVLTDPKSEHWFGQSYDDNLKVYDYVIIMAYPKMEKVKKPEKWLKGLVKEVNRRNSGIKQTVFKVQTYDWDRKRKVKTEEIDKWLKALVAEGARHVAYYPDLFLDDHPQADIIKMMMSTEAFPFKREWK